MAYGRNQKLGFSILWRRFERAARWQHIARYSQCILFTERIYVCRYISEQKATFGGRERGAARVVRGARAGGVLTHTTPPKHTGAARRVRMYRTSERANRPTRSTYSYYYERRNAFCRARTKFVVPLPLLIIKIVNAFLLAEVCAVTHRCRVFFSFSKTCNVFKCTS
ncbi:unnamed protein product, partial [Brenthis ino]